MNKLGIFVSMLALYSCGSADNPRTPPDIQVVNYDPLLQKTENGWRYKRQPFSGYMVEIETDGRVVYRLPILNGKEWGLARGWYNTGEKLLERRFVAGKKEGSFRQWWPNGRYRYVFQYKNDQYNGVQFVFFPNGKKREESHYRNGEKEGSQRVWDEAGQVVSNYTIRNQRVYGVVSIESCIPPGEF
jgi:antitoxin component YwqK of YwqJK toxin-antitoxin module